MKTNKPPGRAVRLRPETSANIGKISVALNGLSFTAIIDLAIAELISSRACLRKLK